MNEKDFIFSKDIELDGIVKWTAPSNIAIVKYWGKLENQIPFEIFRSHCLSQ